MTAGLENRYASVSFKAGIIGLLALAMLWPLSRVESLVSERQALQAQAYEVIAAGFGGPQVLGGPIISVSTQERTLVVDPNTKGSTEAWSEGAPLHLLPDSVRITDEVAVTVRRKGIYSVPVYVSKVVITGEFNVGTIADLLRPADDTHVISTRADFQVPLSEVKYLRALTRFEVDGETLRAATGEVAGLPALTSPIDLSGDRSHPLAFRLELEFAGTDSLHFLPLGAHTAVTAHVRWPHPDFDGAFLPVDHDIGASGYSATWDVLELNRAIPQMWRGEAVTKSALLANAFGVRMFQPSNIYTENYRAVRYGILFIAVTFACFFMCEHLIRGLRLHPIQYLFVGLGLATFYLLLLALSEHIGFGFAYFAASAALVALITAYVTGATDNRLAAFGIGAALSATFGVLYVVLLSEDYALLFGSLLLFTVLAALMLATRRLDWSKVGRENLSN